MGIPKENNNERASQLDRKVSILMFVLLLMAVLGLSFFVYMKSQGIDIIDFNKILSPKSNSAAADSGEDKQVFSIPYDSKERPVFQVYDGMLIRGTKDGICGLNKKGEQLWKINAVLNNPILKPVGSKLLVLDIGGKEIFVLKENNILWQNAVDGNIINASISASGHVAVVHESEGYRCTIRVYDPMGTEMFSRYIDKKFVISADVSPAGDLFVINSIDASGAEINPQLQFFNIHGDPREPFAAISLRINEIFPFIWYRNDNSIFAVSDISLLYYDRGRKEQWSQQYERVSSTCPVGDKYIAAAVRNDGDLTFLKGISTEVAVFDIRGQKTASCYIDGDVINLRAYSNIIAVNAVREAYFIDVKGNLIGKYTPKSDIIDICLFSKVEAAVITKSSVDIVRFN